MVAAGKDCEILTPTGDRNVVRSARGDGPIHYIATQLGRRRKTRTIGAGTMRTHIAMARAARVRRFFLLELDAVRPSDVDRSKRPPGAKQRAPKA